MKFSKSQKLKTILKKSEEERIKLKHPYVGSEHLFLSIISYNNELSNFLKEYGVTYVEFKKSLIEIVGSCTKDNPKNLYTPLLRKVLKRYELKVKEPNQDDFTEENLFISILDEGEGIAIRILLKMNVDLDEIYVRLKEKQKILLMEETSKVGVLLNSVVDNSEMVISRDEEINKIILTLSRKKKCNPLLVGPAGVGKTALVEELARRINKKQVPKSLINKKIFLLDMGSLISGTKYRGEFEERLNNIIKEVKNDGNTIIFIDEVHTMIGAGGAEGAINASDILKPYLARGDIKCIGATTNIEYNKSFNKDLALQRRFEVINIDELNNEMMKSLLVKVKKEYERYHNVKVSNSLISKLIDLSNIYIKSTSNPDKSIELLDSSCAYASFNKKTKLTEEDILNVIYYKTKNPFVSKIIPFDNLKNKLKIYFKNDDINMFIKRLKNVYESPKLIVTNTIDIKNIILDNYKNENIINIDCKKESNNCSKLYDIKDNFFKIIIFNNLDINNDYIVDCINKIKEEGYIENKIQEKIYLNNSLIVVQLNASDCSNMGFTKQKTNKEFINSFPINMCIETKKEIIHS